jgi:hypothetical protein
MKLDPGMHIGMHLVCFSKTMCDSFFVQSIGVGSNHVAEEVPVTLATTKS